MSLAVCVSWSSSGAGAAEAVVRRDGGIPLGRIIRRALHMGDELHSRNTAATPLLTRELTRPCWSTSPARAGATTCTWRSIHARERLLLPAPVDGRREGDGGLRARRRGSSVVTAMTINCRRSSPSASAGSGDEWFLGPQPEVEAASSSRDTRRGHRVDRRREPHHRDGRTRRLRPGGRLRAPGVPGRQRREAWPR